MTLKISGVISLINLKRFVPVILLSSCIAPPSLYQEAFLTSKAAVFDKKLIVTDYTRNLPYAMQIARIGNSKEVLLVLSEARYGDHLIWSSSSKELITTFNGKIIRTLGLSNDMQLINPPNIIEIYKKLLNNNDIESAHESLINFTSPKANSLELIQSYSIYKEDTIIKRLNNKSVDTIILQEDINIPIIRFKAKNLYWIDSEMNIIRSQQQVSPNMKSLELNSLKKYNGS